VVADGPAGRLAKDKFKRAQKAGCFTGAVMRPSLFWTVSEEIEFCRSLQAGNTGVALAGARGDTNDDFAADFAVAMKVGQLRFGSMTRAEDTAKLGRLLVIEQELGPSRCQYIGRAFREV
jgi:enolase